MMIINWWEMARKTNISNSVVHIVWCATVSAGNVFTWPTSSSAAHPLLFILIFPFNVQSKFIRASTKWFPIADDALCVMCTVYSVHSVPASTNAIVSYLRSRRRRCRYHSLCIRCWIKRCHQMQANSRNFDRLPAYTNMKSRELWLTATQNPFRKRKTYFNSLLIAAYWWWAIWKCIARIGCDWILFLTHQSTQ